MPKQQTGALIPQKRLFYAKNGKMAEKYPSGCFKTSRLQFHPRNTPFFNMNIKKVNGSLLEEPFWVGYGGNS